MRTFGKIGSCILSICALFLIGGCSGTTSGSVPPGATGPAEQQSDSSDAGASSLLAVAGQKSGSVVLYDGAYKPVETITGYAAGAIYDDRYDRHGNLYVTDMDNAVVNEYAKGQTAPTFEYTALVSGPIGVTTDSHDDVYVANYIKGVTEYRQQQNVPIHACTIPGYAVGVAVANADHVFVSFNGFSSGRGGIVEFEHGLNSCKEEVLKATLKGPYTGKLQVDLQENLVVADQESGTVDIIAPPYSSITRAIPGCRGPFGVALNKKNTLLYVACAREVRVDNYPKGLFVKTLRGNGIREPVGVAAYP